MKLRSVLAGAMLAGMFGWCSAPASAQEAGCWSGMYGWGLPYSHYDLEHVPYFALHPPVYYSYPVARPYGYSPFAYPPSVMTPELKPEEPKMMYNPFVPSNPAEETQPAAVEGKTASSSQPLRLVNPFVESAETQLAPAPQRVQRVFPASLAR